MSAHVDGNEVKLTEIFVRKLDYKCELSWLVAGLGKWEAIHTFETFLSNVNRVEKEDAWYFWRDLLR